MPRDGSNIYHIPLGTEGVPDTTIESNKYNTFAHDIERDLNTPRPIISGGTGGTSPDGALAALNAEKAGQFVTNFDSFAWLAGSFYSDITATAAPVAGHAFSGIAYISSPQVMAVEARDMTDPGNAMYVRVKTAGVWGPWVTDNASQYVKKAGDSMTGLLTLSGDPTANLHAATKQYVDSGLANTVIVSATRPAAARDSSLWWESDSGLLYVNYNDGDSTQWVLACPQPDISSFVQISGDTMTGILTLHADPVAPLDAATKQYVDAHEVRAGTIRFTMWDVAEVGWLMFDDGTVGSATSGASFANAGGANLFKLMYNKIIDAWAPIYTSAGVLTTRTAQINADTAWLANCRIALPKTLGRAFAMGGAGAGLTARPLGSFAGEETHTPTLAEMVTHSHGGITSDDLEDHTHSYTYSQGVQNGPPGGANLLTAAASGTTGGASNRHQHAIPNAGSSTPHNVMSPEVFFNAEIKL